MAQLPADRTKLNAAVANQQPSIVASAKANREALIEAYDTIDLLNQKVDTAISNGKMGNEIASDVDMKGYSLINANNVAAKSANIDAPNNGGFARIGIKNTAQVLDLAAYWEAGITQFAQVQSWDIVDNAPRLLRLNPLGGPVSINDYVAWHNGNNPASPLGTGTGYQKLASGLIVQWGFVTVPPNNVATPVTFPIAFPTVVAIVITNARNAGALASASENITNTGFDCYQNHPSLDRLVHWLAIGW